ncbi:related to DNA-directed RNA polymerase III subunit RPC9 [Saccharomycodes ludwigii]|uniref:DNA-directed RNA polymerase III subunit RPC9 n=1 Tax=Saccharomycodes ludwigii TaxID=36035 RepID=A0A376B296_9ASCO|nr:hypothetical protein SCDLUD_004493 [Saccharomycodes ludwigii]KAH3899070.1 hypothetical protein SCDLUD_004493 [Saccharomycodes ludwigii]SSD58815.1 related to DNA-directed RNA polymerase III subunit RPC9 [Saccharomycodes ludwigii]
MKIESVRESFLSDYEVYTFLKDLQRKNGWLYVENKKNHNNRNKYSYNNPELESITKNVVDYLATPKSMNPDEEDQSNSGSTSGTDNLLKFTNDKFIKLLQKLNCYKLYKIEKLQLVNQLPTNFVHLYSIIEECDSRFSEQEIEQILTDIKEVIST